MRHDGGIVYSTQHGNLCPRCEHPVNTCVCDRTTPIDEVERAKAVVRVSRETKGRKGKGVSLVSGLPLDAKELEALCKRLKKRCGSGGTVKSGVIEIQGDHRDTLVRTLESDGWNVKRAGG